ncbi:hypothetical protein NPIL_328861 [Nephila pilipes]|uniref:Uncharacterized protein n=1 Tax=Nephila pilipes TaxID=299642 RepID=A0A8X6QC37_NEPPI|nr:hypothetical protein NPIL_328861 [Nephila pilipes]
MSIDCKDDFLFNKIKHRMNFTNIERETGNSFRFQEQFAASFHQLEHFDNPDDGKKIFCIKSPMEDMKDHLSFLHGEYKECYPCPITSGRAEKD